MIANNEKAVNQINSDLDNDNNKKDDKSTSTNTIISCWGDVITYGEGGDGVTYPSELANLTNLTVYNYGFKGENTKKIAAMQGGVSLYTKKFTIPSNKEAVEIKLYDKLGHKYTFKNKDEINKFTKMANHKSSKKRIRQTEVKNARNKYYHKTARNAVKALRNTTEKDAAVALLPKVTAMLDKLAKTNVIHKNKAANLKSSVQLHVNAL